MSATSYSCEACEELREEAPSLVCNGFDDSMCTSLQNDTGLVASSGNNDCHDLNNLNDCLVGNMEAEIDMFEVCDWKTYTKQFVGNLWTVLEAIICAICGLWTNIHSIWDKINEMLEKIKKLQCVLDHLAVGGDIAATLSEDAFVAGAGISFNRSDSHVVRPNVIVSGSTYTIGASIRVNLTNSYWKGLGTNNNGGTVSGNKINTPNGNYTICIIRIPTSVLPKGTTLVSCVGQFVNSGVGQIYAQVITAGNTYVGQWGEATSGRATVPDGYVYIRLSLTSLTTWGAEYGDDWADVTIRATGLALTNPNAIEC